MKLDIVLYLLVQIPLFSGGMHCCKFGLKGSNVTCKAFCGQASGHFLESGSHRIDLGQFSPGNSPDMSSPVGRRFDEAQGFQFTQCFTHRSLADFKLLCYLHFNEPVSGLILTAQDPFEQNLLELFA